MSAALETFSLERDCRRAGWRPGWAIRLADGSRWHLPTIGADLLAEDRDLADDLREAEARARTPTTDDEDPQSNLDALCQYHGCLARIAIRILRANYELPNCTWEGLVIGNSLIETFQLTLALAFALEEERRRLHAATAEPPAPGRSHPTSWPTPTRVPPGKPGPGRGGLPRKLDANPPTRERD